MFTQKEYFLIKKLRQFNNYVAVETFLTQANLLIQKLKLDTDTPNFLCALPEVSKNMNIQFTNKIIIAVNFTSKTPLFEYILPNNGHEYYAQKGLKVKNLGQLELLNNGIVPAVLGFDVVDFENDIKQLWLETAQEAIKSYKTNAKKYKFNYELYNIITNPIYKEQIVNFAKSTQSIPENMNQMIEMDIALSQKKPLNQILFGPPGTGKTYKLHHEYFNQFTQGKDKHYKLVTFHQNFTYEDFIEGIKPITLHGNLHYKIEQGIFYQACEEAVLLAGYKSLADCIDDTKEGRQEAFKEALPYAIFIDEINRANVSSVLGELITLIEEDKRLGAENEITDISLPYSKKLFGVPSNLYIIGTMNTADRSVEALDTALRRRFSFEEMPPQPQKLADNFEGINLQKLLEIINKRIEKLLNKDHLIGHSFFMQIESLLQLKSVFQHKILPLLQEYFFGDYGKIGLILGEGFVHIQKSENNIFATLKGYDESDFSERKTYLLANLIEMSDAHFIEALEKLSPEIRL